MHAQGDGATLCLKTTRAEPGVRPCPLSQSRHNPTRKGGEGTRPPRSQETQQDPKEHTWGQILGKVDERGWGAPS